MKNKILWGPAIAIALGIGGIIGSFQSFYPDQFIIFLIVILGALAYYSAKMRALGIWDNNKWRKLFEVASLLFVVFTHISLLKEYGLKDMGNFIFLWIYVAYFVAIKSKKNL